jgi:type II secretory pathway component PulF
MSERTKDFEYVATSGAGKRVKGSIAASSVERAYQLILAQGLSPIKVTKKADGFLQQDINIPGFEKKAKLKPLAVFCKQFALLVRSGMPMLESIRISADQTEDKVLKNALEEVADEVEAGATLAASMRKHELAFPGLLSSVVAVGEEGGFLEKSLDSMAKTYKTELELRQRLKSALSYPVIVVVASVAILTVMLIFVVPIFAEMFEGLGAEIPAPTQVLVNISNNAVVILPIMIVLLIAFTIFYKKYKKEIWMVSRVDKWKLKIPVFGPLNTKVAIARFTRNLAMMLKAGVSLVTALRLVATTADNWIISQAVEHAVGDMENGKTFSSSIGKFTMFPPMVTQMIVVGEQSGSLAAMLDTVADFYDEEVKEASDTLTQALEPILILVLGGLVGGMLFALYMPMFTLFAAMSEG